MNARTGSAPYDCAGRISEMETHEDIVHRLRQDAEMLKDGHQKNLTKLWHSEVVKDTAVDAMEAVTEIQLLRSRAEQDAKRIEELSKLLSDLYAMVWGECPSLLDEDSGGSARLDMEIIAALQRGGA